MLTLTPRSKHANQLAKTIRENVVKNHESLHIKSVFPSPYNVDFAAFQLKKINTVTEEGGENYFAESSMVFLSFLPRLYISFI